MKTNIRLLSHLAQFYLEWEMFLVTIIEKIKHTSYAELTFWKIVPFEIMWENIVQSKSYRWHGGCVLHAGYLKLQTHTQNYCFSTAKNVTRRRLNGTYSATLISLLPPIMQFSVLLNAEKIIKFVTCNSPYGAMSNILDTSFKNMSNVWPKKSYHY